MYYGLVDSTFFAEETSVLINTQNSVLLIVDSQVKDYLKFLNGTHLGVRIAVLDSQQDGVKQITEILEQGAGWQQIYLISDGSPGCLRLGNTELSLTTIHDYKFALEKWSRYLYSDGELVLYGCQVATGDAGKEFLSKLHQILQIEIICL